VSNAKNLLAERRLNALDAASQSGRYGSYRKERYVPLRSASHDRMAQRRLAVGRIEPEKCVTHLFHHFDFRTPMRKRKRVYLKQGRLLGLRMRIQHQCMRAAA
jgi:hypothetical protein